MSAKPLENENEQINGAIALFRDITFRKQMEQSREKLARHNEGALQILACHCGSRQ